VLGAPGPFSALADCYARDVIRIRKTRWKVGYVLLGIVLDFIVNAMIQRVVPYPLAVVVANVLYLALFFGGTRLFRGNGEPVAPPRAWWRMTSRARAGFVVGSLLCLSFASDILFLFTRQSDIRFSYVVAAIVDAGLAFLYFRSSIRLRKDPPELVVEVAPLPRWKPMEF
jgi:hypothetical protein